MKVRTHIEKDKKRLDIIASEMDLKFFTAKSLLKDISSTRTTMHTNIVLALSIQN